MISNTAGVQVLAEPARGVTVVEACEKMFVDLFGTAGFVVRCGVERGDDGGYS